MTLDEFARALVEEQSRRRLAKHSEIWQPRSTAASSLGYRCERRLVYARTHPHYSAPIGAALASIFEEGDLHEFDVKRELAELGHEPIEGQRLFRDEQLDISGRIDCMLAVGDGHHAEIVPTEIKSCADDPPDTVEGLRDHDGIHARQYAQLLTYLVLSNKPNGLMLFKRKVTGLWTVVAVPLDYEYAEGLLKKAERVRDHVRAGTLPDRIADRGECDGCPWRETICHPAEAPVDPLLMVRDEQLLAQLEERERITPIAERWGKLDKSIKARFKLTKGDRFVVGDNGFYIQKRPHGDGVRLDIRRLTSVGPRV